RVKRTAAPSSTRKTMAPGIRTSSGPTCWRRRQRYEPSNGIASADLEDAGAQVAEQQLDRARGRDLEGPGQVCRLGEAQGGGLLAVRLRLPLPPSRQEEQREVVGDVAVRVVEGVALGVGEAGDRDQVAGLDPQPGLLAQLVDRGAGEAATLLGGTARQAPGVVVPAPGEQHLPVRPLRRHRGTRDQDEIVADLLPPPPQI